MFVDIYQVRHARVRIIKLRNDLAAITSDIAKALEVVYDPSAAPAANSSSSSEASASVEEGTSKPFAKVDGVAPDSPAAEAVCSFVKPSVVNAEKF